MGQGWLVALCLQYFHHTCVLETYLHGSLCGPGMSHKTLYLPTIPKTSMFVVALGPSLDAEGATLYRIVL